MSPQYVGVLEEGGNIASLTTALDLAEVLGADIAEITRELSVARNTPRKAPET